MYEVVFVIFKSFLRVCGRLLPFFSAMFLGGWTLFRVQQGASIVWLAIPIMLIGALAWRLSQSSPDQFD
jgi:hypothetical protein